MGDLLYFHVVYGIDKIRGRLVAFFQRGPIKIGCQGFLVNVFFFYLVSGLQQIWMDFI